jgi:uncharacterized protein YqeY
VNRELGSIEARIREDATDALRAGDKRRRTALSTFVAALKKERIDARSETTTEAAEMVVLKREQKRRSEAIVMYDDGGRADLAEQARYEAELLAAYLPAQLGDDELQRLVAEAIAETGAASPKEMGKVMSALVPRVAGRADGKRLSELVRSRLGA